MPLLNVDVGRTLSVGLPSELDIKRLICALLAGDINNLLKGPLICINTHIDDLLGRLPSNALSDALKNLQNRLGNLLQQAGIIDILGRLNSATSQLESLFGLGGICPVPFTLPRIGNVLGDMVAGYMGAAGNIISDIAQFEQALSHICLGTGGIGPDWGNMTGGIGPNWGNMTGGILSRLNQDINTFGGDHIPENVMAQYQAQLVQSAAAIAGISDRMAGGVGSDAANVAAAASTAFQLAALYNKLGDYPVSDGNIVYDNVFKMFLDANVYDAMLAAANPGTPLITKEQSVLDNCGRPVSTKTVVVQGDLLTRPFDATVDAVQTPIPTPALGDFTLYQPDMEINVFAVNLLPGDNPDIHLIKGRSYLIKLDLVSLKFYVYRTEGTANPPGGEYQKPHLSLGANPPASSNLYSTGMAFEDGSKGDQAQGKQMGFLTWNIPTDAPDQLQYRDSSGAVIGNIYLRSVDVAAGTGGGGYTLPTASTTVLGGVKVDGTTITVDNNGVITSNGGYVLPPATASTLGGVRIDGTTITINGSGVISATSGNTPSFGTIAVFPAGQDNIVANIPGAQLNLTAGTGGISLTTNATSRLLTIENTLTAANQTSATPVGATNYGIFKSKVDSQLQLRSLIAAGSGLAITTSADGNALILTSSAVLSAANSGTGYGVFKEQVGTALVFKAIKAGSGVTLASDGSDITINVPSVQNVLSGTATTTDASATVITWSSTLSMPTNSSWFFEVTFIGRRTDGTVERNAFKLEGVYDNTSGTISLVGPAAKTTYQNTATNWDVNTFVFSGQPRFVVYGEVGKTVKWTAWLRYQQVSDT